MIMPTTGNTQLDQAIATIAALAPIAGLVSPQAGIAAAAAVDIAPMAISLLNNAFQLTQAGAMTNAQLAALFATVSANLQTTHATWDAMNAAAANPVAAPPAPVVAIP